MVTLPTGRDGDICIAVNGGEGATAFQVPVSPQGRRWRRVINTSLPSPADIVADESAGKLVAEGSRYAAVVFSVVVLAAEGYGRWHGDGRMLNVPLLALQSDVNVIQWERVAWH